MLARTSATQAGTVQSSSITPTRSRGLFDIIAGYRGVGMVACVVVARRLTAELGREGWIGVDQFPWTVAIGSHAASLRLLERRNQDYLFSFGFRNRRKSNSRKDAKRAKFKIKKFTGLKQIHFLLADLFDLANFREIIRLSVPKGAKYAKFGMEIMKFKFFLFVPSAEFTLRLVERAQDILARLNSLSLWLKPEKSRDKFSHFGE